MYIYERLKSFLHIKTFAVCFSLSLVWILGSDFIVHHLVPAEFNTELLQNAKGIFFTLVLCIILSWLHKREDDANNRLMAEKKQSMLGEFSGMIVHEVKNPLHSIQICITRLKSMVSEKEFDGERYLSLMNDSFVRLNDTIDFLQTLSRGRKINNIIKTPQVDPSEHIEKIFTFLNKSFIGMDVKLEIQGIVGLRLDMNESLMGHVFLNLIKNSMEYLRDNHIENGKICFTNHSDEKNIIIGISNSGEPISSEVQRKLFDHYTSKSDKGGSGLGLIFCRQVMQAHGGKIVYDSSATTPRFLLYFPPSLKS